MRSPDYPVEILYKYLQKLLSDHQVRYMVAPYSAVAQVSHFSSLERTQVADITKLAYLEKQPEQYVDAIMGTTDGFLFNVDKVITNISPANGSFSWLSKAACQERLEKISDDLFRDCQLLLGTPFLPTFPLLGNTANVSSIRDALVLLNASNRSVVQLCHQYRAHPQVQQLQYLNRYKKAIMTIKHHVVLETNGKVAPLDFHRAPGDVHEFVGQRLPEELYFYISQGMLSPQVPNWLTSGEILLTLPGGCADTETYRRLVVDQLGPLRTQSLLLLSSSLHRYYQTRPVTTRVWYDGETADKTINLKEMPPLKQKVASWKIREQQFPDSIRKQSVSLTVGTYMD